MEEDMKKLAELVGSKKNYTTKTHEEIKELYMKVFGNGDKENEKFLNTVDLYIVSYGLGIVLQHNPGIDLREIGMARYENFYMFTITKPCIENGTEKITGIDEVPDVLFKKDEKIGEFTPESIKAIYPTVTIINSIDEEKIIDNRTKAIHRMMKKMRSNGSNSSGRTRICKSKLRIDFNKYKEKNELLTRDMVHVFEDNLLSDKETIIPQDDTLRIKQMNLEAKQLLSDLKSTVNGIEATHRDYLAQQIDDSYSNAEHIDDEESPGQADERLDVKKQPNYPLLTPEELEVFFGDPRRPRAMRSIDVSIEDISNAVERRQSIQKTERGCRQ